MFERGLLSHDKVYAKDVKVCQTRLFLPLLLAEQSPAQWLVVMHTQNMYQ